MWQWTHLKEHRLCSKAHDISLKIPICPNEGFPRAHRELWSWYRDWCYLQKWHKPPWAGPAKQGVTSLCLQCGRCTNTGCSWVFSFSGSPPDDRQKCWDEPWPWSCLISTAMCREQHLPADTSQHQPGIPSCFSLSIVPWDQRWGVGGRLLAVQIALLGVLWVLLFMKAARKRRFMFLESYWEMWCFAFLSQCLTSHPSDT